MPPQVSARPIEILLVEDSRMDIILTQEALKEAKIHNNLHVVTDGEKAMQFLRREDIYTNAPRPDIILLDLNLPLKDGREILLEIKQDQSLRRIPVVVMTTSSAEEDIIKSYDLHVNCFVTKPVDMHQFLEVVKSISNFWLSVVALPREES